ncbi:MAG: T9SS type A sorting domain-containing protein [Bacteroidales bacterium]|nr:T9SS type A sorting domain-containing protein [Bacteroidales bacterium]
MVKFITKSVCMALIAMLCVSTLSAQTERSAPKGMQQPSIQTGTNASLFTDNAFAPVRGSDSETISTTGSGPTWKGTVANPLAQQVGNAGAVQCLDYIEGVYYGVRWSSGNQFGTVDPTTGAWTSIKTGFQAQGSDGASICYNPVNGLTYVFPWTGSDSEAPRFGTVDLATGDFTTIATWGYDGAKTYYAAIDEDGTCYALENLTTNFGTIDLATGNFTVITTNLPGTVNYIQDISFDRETGELYWIAQTDAVNAYFKIDKATGATTNIGGNSQNPQGFAINTWFGSGGDDCPAVTDVTADVYEATKVKVTWTAPSKALTGYKIYQDGTEKATVAEGVTEWISDALANGTYTFAVAATFDDGCTPVKVAAAPVEIKTCNGKVSNLDVKYETDCSKATLTWDAPAKSREYEGWMKWCVNDEITGRVGWSSSSGNDMIAAIRFTPADLANLGIESGQAINKVSLGLGTELSAITTMEIRIWEGGSSITDPGTLVYTFPIAGPFGSYPESTMAEFDIDEYTIDVSKELRIGWRVVNTVGYPFGRDAGPNVAGKGILIYCADSPISGWADTYSLLGLDANWSLKAWVTEGSGPPPDAEYNIYRDAIQIGGPTKETTFEDTEFNPEQPYTWSVAVACLNGGDGEWVDVEKDACIDNPPDPCDPITGGTAAVVCDEAVITWTAVTGAVGYKVSKDGATTTVTEPAYTETGEFEDGVSYTWTVVTVCDEDESDPVEITGVADCSTPGIPELANSVSIYPNPANTTVTISALNFAKVEIYNTVGQLIETRTDQSVEVSSYNTGVYFFKVYDVYNNSVTKRVMVAK